MRRIKFLCVVKGLKGAERLVHCLHGMKSDHWFDFIQSNKNLRLIIVSYVGGRKLEIYYS